MSNPREQKADAQARQRATRALDLRLAGARWAAIADTLEYADPSGPRKAVDKLLTRVEHEGVEQLRELEGARLDRLQVAAWGQAVGGDLEAIKTMLAITDRRTKLYGLNSPVRVQVGQDATDVQWAEQFATLIEELDPEALSEVLMNLPGDAGRALLTADGQTAGAGYDDTPGQLSSGSGAQRAESARPQRPANWSNL